MVHLVDPPIPYDRDYIDSQERGMTEQGTQLKKFTVQDVETVLNVLAMNGGNYSRTSEQVGKEYGIEIHPVTLKKWATTQFPSKYAVIQRTLADKINDVVAGRIGDLALTGTEVQHRLLQQLAERIDEEPNVPIKELAPAVRNIAQATQTNIQQRQLLEGKPTGITELRNIEETVRELEQNEILVDAEVVEEEDVDENDGEKLTEFPF
jgi:hypothetical protein